MRRHIAIGLALGTLVLTSGFARAGGCLGKGCQPAGCCQGRCTAAAQACTVNQVCLRAEIVPHKYTVEVPVIKEFEAKTQEVEREEAALPAGSRVRHRPLHGLQAHGVQVGNVCRKGESHRDRGLPGAPVHHQDGRADQLLHQHRHRKPARMRLRQPPAASPWVVTIRRSKSHHGGHRDDRGKCQHGPFIGNLSLMGR